MTTLTPAEERVLRAYAQIGDVKTVAYRSGRAYQTVKDQLYSAYRRLGVSGAFEAFRAMGWLRIPDDMEVPGSEIAGAESPVVLAVTPAPPAIRRVA